MKHLIIVCFGFLLMVSCAHQEGRHKDHPIEQDIQIGESLKAHRYSNIYFSAQPSDADLKQLKAQGFTAVINLRQEKEENYQESQEREGAENHGLAYAHIPKDPTTPITDEFISQVTAAVKRHRPQGKILVHCSSGNRAGMWLGGHFFKDHGFSKEESLELAKKMGLEKEPAIKKVKDYLDQAKRN